jgi:hypothetical protein
MTRLSGELSGAKRVCHGRAWQARYAWNPYMVVKMRSQFKIARENPRVVAFR